MVIYANENESELHFRFSIVCRKMYGESVLFFGNNAGARNDHIVEHYHMDIPV